jgi:hypothetical protein
VYKNAPITDTVYMNAHITDTVYMNAPICSFQAGT